jgi:hypothetical protein
MPEVYKSDLCCACFMDCAESASRIRKFYQMAQLLRAEDIRNTVQIEPMLVEAVLSRIYSMVKEGK